MADRGWELKSGSFSPGASAFLGKRGKRFSRDTLSRSLSAMPACLCQLVVMKTRFLELQKQNYNCWFLELQVQILRSLGGKDLSPSYGS